MRVRDAYERRSMLVALDAVLEGGPGVRAVVWELAWWEGTDLSHVIAYVMGQRRQWRDEKLERHRRRRARKAKARR